MIVTKEELRRKFLRKRIEYDPELRKISDQNIIKNLVSLREFKKARSILLYCSIKGEPDLSPLFDRILTEDKELILPKVEGSNLSLYSVNSVHCLTNGTFNIPEPSDGKKIKPEDLDLAIVPGIIFDRQGYRIGFGKGYYDRLLERVSAPKVGVAYSFQVLDELPRDPWDKPVDIIVTEEEVIRRS